MIATVWLVLSSLLYSLQLSTGSFPKPLTESEERHYLTLAKQGAYVLVLENIGQGSREAFVEEKKK